MNPLSVLPKTPLNLITIDFETFYDSEYTLSKTSTEEYIRDRRFEIIGVGVAEGTSAPIWMSEKEFRFYCENLKISGAWKHAAVLCHHTHFDGLILAHHFGVQPGFWLDTLSMSRGLHSPVEVGGSLAKLAAKYGVGEKGDEVVKAKGKHRFDFTGEEWNRYGEYCKQDVALTRAIFLQMLPHFPEAESWLVDATIRMFTEPALLITTPILKTALSEEQGRKAELLTRLAQDASTPTTGTAMSKLMSNNKFALLLADLGVETPTKISPATGKETFAFAKSDPGMKALLEHPVDEVRWLAEARVGVKSSIVESRIQRFLGVADRGPAPVYLSYAAAHTKRWGGGDKTNYQNLPRGTKEKPSPLRTCLEAPGGQMVVACDSGQIEARGVAWLAGHEALLQSFREGRDVYSEFASEAYGRIVDPKNGPEDKVARFVGKVCVLGLGYGMGWKKFAATMLAGALGGPPVVFGQKEVDLLGVDVANFAADKGGEAASLVTRLKDDELMAHCAVAKSFVDKYRRVNAPVPALWKFMDKVISAMAMDHEVQFGPGNVFKTEHHAILLPNGLRLKYPGLTNDGDGWSYLGGRVGKERTRIYGGSLTENLVQAFCRNIVADQMLYLWGRYGHRPVMMTHDEVVFCVAEGRAKEALEQAVEVMKMSPAWCPGIPLAAEGGYAKSYGGCK